MNIISSANQSSCSSCRNNSCGCGFGPQCPPQFIPFPVPGPAGPVGPAGPIGPTGPQVPPVYAQPEKIA